MKRIIELLAVSWCKFAHPAPYWPCAGAYRCRVCQRVHRVQWEQKI